MLEQTWVQSLPTWSKEKLQEQFAENIIKEFIKGEGKATKKELKEFLAKQLEEYHRKRLM